MASWRALPHPEQAAAPWAQAAEPTQKGRPSAAMCHPPVDERTDTCEISQVLSGGNELELMQILCRLERGKRKLFRNILHIDGAYVLAKTQTVPLK